MSKAARTLVNLVWCRTHRDLFWPRVWGPESESLLRALAANIIAGNYGGHP